MKFTWKKILVFFGIIAVLAASNFFAYSEMKKSYQQRESYILTQNKVLRSKVTKLRTENSKIKKNIEKYEETTKDKDGNERTVKKTKTQIQIEREITEKITKEVEAKIRKQLEAEYERKYSKKTTKKTASVGVGGYVDPSGLEFGYYVQGSYGLLGPVDLQTGLHSDGRFTLGLGINF